MDESKAMYDLNTRIQQLMKPILTSLAMDKFEGGNGDGDDETVMVPGCPAKVDFDMSPYQVWHSCRWGAWRMD